MARQILTAAQKEQARALKRQEAARRIASQQAQGESFLKPRTPDAVAELNRKIPVENRVMTDPSGQVDAAITAGGAATLDPYIDALPAPFDPATNSFNNSREFKTELINQEQAAQAEAGIKIAMEEPEIDEAGNVVGEIPATLDVATAEELIEKPEMQEIISAYDTVQYDQLGLKKERTGVDVEVDLETLVDMGDAANQIVPRIMLPTITGNTEIESKIQSELINLGLLNEDTGTLSQKIGMGLAAAIAIEGKNVLDKEDKRITGRGNTFNDVDLSANMGSRRLDADEFRNNISTRLFDIITESPIQEGTGDIRPGFGGGSATVSSDVKAATNALLNQALDELGMFAVVERENEPDYIAISDEGAAYIRGMQELMIDMGFIGDVDTSSVPTIGGNAAPFAAREKGRAKEGSRSQTTKQDPNTGKADLIKSILGSIPYKVVANRFIFSQMMVNEVTAIEQVGNRSRVIIRNVPIGQEGEWSSHPYAKTLGLDKAKWLKAYDHALKTMDKQQAIAQANSVMIKEARKLRKIIQQGITKSNQVFYNKIMDASSVGRFFIRNTVLNPQDSKSLARMFVGSAQKTYINPVTDVNSDSYEAFLYITGRNLLTDQDVARYLGREIDVEDLGYDAIVRLSKQALEDGTWDGWVKKGRTLMKVVNILKQDPRANYSGFLNADPSLQPLFDELTTKGEWGYAFQSYLDAANFDLSKQQNNGNTQAVAAILEEMGMPPDTVVGRSFVPEAQTQHDGKQNGIAIQALQMGNAELLKRTGLMYQGEDEVLPLGDIRKLFMQNINMGVTFATKMGSMSDERYRYWTDFFKKIENNGELRKLLSKQPLMEVSYGRYYLFNQETARDFIDNEEASRLLNLEGYQYNRTDAIKDLNLIIAGTIEPTLNFKHQKIYKDAGLVFAMLGVVPELLGPMGNKIYMGSKEYYSTDKSLMIDIGDEIQEVPVRKARFTGSARMRNRKLVLDEKTNKWTMQPASVFGQEVANQLPVLPIQQIDAAVMGESVLEVNRAAFENKRGVKFLIPVHDAIITDVSSVKEYHTAMNKNFVKINKRYSVNLAIKEGLQAAMDRSLKKINDNQMYDLNDESKFRAVHSQLLQYKKQLDEGKSKVISADGILEETDSRGANWMKDIIREATIGDGAYWNADGSGSISGRRLKRIITAIAKKKNVMLELEKLQKISDRNKARIYADPIFKLIGAQYN